MSPLPMLGATLSLKATKQANGKSDTGNSSSSSNNNNNSSISPSKDATHSPSEVYKENKSNNNNNNNNHDSNKNNEKNFHVDENVEKVKNLKVTFAFNEAENPTPTQQQQEKQQQQLVNETKIVTKKVKFNKMKTTTETTTTSTTTTSSSSSTTMITATTTAAAVATATCDNSNNSNSNNSNNKTNPKILGNDLHNNKKNSNNNNSATSNSNKNKNASANNSITSITSNGVKIKIEECDESIEIKAEAMDLGGEGSAIGGAITQNSMQRTTTNVADKTKQNQKQATKSPHHNDSEIKSKPSSSNSSSSSSSKSCNGNTNTNSASSTTITSVVATQKDHSQQQQSQQPNDGNDLIFARPKPVLLTAVNPHIICNLCYGYLIDATTIVECLHSFCHSCLIKHLRTEQYCPRCEMMINTAKPNIKPDTTLQAIVYKLVPGLYEKELLRRRAFYKNHPEDAALATPEQRGDDTEHLIFSPSEYMSLSLEYADVDDQISSNAEYSELLRPRFIQCPAKFTVAHMKKFVCSKFSIDCQRFSIDIMYKVKTILLLDHYTVMDIAYIYTWKRDEPMRFFFSVKEFIKPLIKQEHTVKETTQLSSNTSYDNRLMTVIHNAPVTPATSPSSSSSQTQLFPLTEIKVEAEMESSPATPSVEKKHFAIVSPRSANDNKSSSNSDADNLKITIVSKPIKEAKANASVVGNSSHAESESAGGGKNTKSHKEKRTSYGANETEQSPKDQSRKIENIKLKIDLSKQNSVTIINMSDPERKEIVKPVRSPAEKEWKVKNKKDKEQTNSNKSPTSGKTTPTMPLTVPPLTLNRSPTTKTNAKQSTAVQPVENAMPEDEKKSQFLKSFALAPIHALQNGDSPKKSASSSTASLSPSTAQQKQQQGAAKSKPSNEFVFKEPAKPPSLPLLSKFLPLLQASKRKSKEPVKSITAKKLKTQTLAEENANLNKNDFKIKLPMKDNASSSSSSTVTSNNKSSSTEQLMPPPSSLPLMRPPIGPAPKKLTKPNTHHSKIPTSNGIIPHPTMPGVQVAAPGNRTPIAKRYQPILPKANPFADLPCSFNQILIDNGTVIKKIELEKSNSGSKKSASPATSAASASTSPVNTPKLMGPPPLPKQKSTEKTPANKSTTATSKPNAPTSLSSSSSAASNSYLNYALYNASKSKGNEAPPGCRTPMYSPNSPIYSPNSPQYAPNYNIPTVPQYKYTPKPTSSSSESILQSILGGSNTMSSLFPSPPIKKANETAASSTNKNNSPPTNQKVDSPQQQQQTQPQQQQQQQQPQQQTSNAFKRPYPYQRSPSPKEDPPEKQLKVKSLLNSCNINIPASLSITITRDAGEQQSNNTSHAKHKNPVNNYIEILKLPDATPNDAKRQSPPVNVNSPFKPPLPAACNNNNSNGNNLSATLKTFRPNNNGNRTTPPPPPLAPTTPPASSTNLNTNKPANNSQLPQFVQPKLPSPPTSNAATTPSYEAARLNQIKPPMQNAQSQNDTKKTPSPKTSPILESNSKSPNQKTMPNDKKTPSPEKRPAAATTNSPPNDSKLAKGANNNVDGTKKFRPILPRFPQAPTATENTSPKSGNSNVIGTYSSPSGVTVNVHGPKKQQTPNVQLPKTNSYNNATPANQQQGQKHQQQQHRGKANQHNQPNLTIQQQNSANAFKSGVPRTIASSRYSPAAKTPAGSPNSVQAAKKTPPTPPPTTSSSTLSPKHIASNKMMTNSPTLPSPQQQQQQQQQQQIQHHQQQQQPPPQQPATKGPTPASIQQSAAAAAQLSVMSAPSSQSEAFQKLFKENLLRAQVHAAAAANPAANMLYTYANAAAAAQMYSASTAPLYSYQHAYIVEQIQRMQRANNEALIGEYLQKIQKANNDLNLGDPRFVNNNLAAPIANMPSLPNVSKALNADLSLTASPPKNSASPAATIGGNKDAAKPQASKAK